MRFPFKYPNIISDECVCAVLLLLALPQAAPPAAGLRGEAAQRHVQREGGEGLPLPGPLSHQQPRQLPHAPRGQALEGHQGDDHRDSSETESQVILEVVAVLPNICPIRLLV